MMLSLSCNVFLSRFCHVSTVFSLIVCFSLLFFEEKNTQADIIATTSNSRSELRGRHRVVAIDYVSITEGPKACSITFSCDFLKRFSVFS